MRKHLGFLLALIGGVAVAALASPGSAAAETVRIAHSTWVGYGPLYVARDKGFFKNHGIDVELIVMEDPKDRFPAMLAAYQRIFDTFGQYFQFEIATERNNGGGDFLGGVIVRCVGELPIQGGLFPKIVRIVHGATSSENSTDQSDLSGCSIAFLHRCRRA